MPYIYGPRLYLRAIEVEDWEYGYRWINDPEVTRFLSFHLLPYSRLKERAWYEQAARGDSRDEVHFAIVLREGDRYIGNTALFAIDWRHRRAGFGIMIGEQDCWDQGYGTEATRLLLGLAFRQLGLHKVWLHVDADNERAIRAYTRAGFRREGVLRDDIYYDGRFHDTITMGILSTEFVPLEH